MPRQTRRLFVNSFSRRRDVDFTFGISRHTRFAQSELTRFGVQAHGDKRVFFHAVAPIMEFGQFEARLGIAALADAQEKLGAKRRTTFDATSFEICATSSQAASIRPCITGSGVEDSFGGGIVSQNCFVIKVREFDACTGAVVETRAAKEIDSARGVRVDSFTFVINEGEGGAVFGDVFVAAFGASFKVACPAGETKRECG